MSGVQILLNIVTFLVLQLCVVVFAYLAYCFHKDFDDLQDLYPHNALHATIGLCAHVVVMTCGIAMITATNFCGRPVNSTARMVCHGWTMTFACCNSMFAFISLPYIYEFGEKIKVNSEKTKFKTTKPHSTLGIFLVVMEFLTLCAGYFLYMSRGISDINKTQRIIILWIHYIMGYATYVLGMIVILTGLSREFKTKDKENKKYDEAYTVITVITGIVVLNLGYKIYKFIASEK